MSRQSEEDRTLFDRIEYHDAERRLDLMEAYASENISAGHRMSMRFKRASKPAPSPIWKPGDESSGLLFGPDGRPIGKPSSSP